MPELPEVEITCRGIVPRLVGRVLEKVTVHNASLRWTVPVAEIEALEGHTVIRVYRRAKYVLIEFETRSILMHLGMSGSLLLTDSMTPLKKHEHIEFSIEGGERLRFNDPRRFGCCLVAPNPVSSHPLFIKLGPEPLTDAFSATTLLATIRGKKRVVKNHIMDASVVVGVGNIYASEALFLARVRPTARLHRLSRKNVSDIVAAIKQVLTLAIESGGSSLRDFRSSEGKLGYFTQAHAVYGRAGEECHRCGAMIRKCILGQRSSFYCPRCQPSR